MQNANRKQNKPITFGNKKIATSQIHKDRSETQANGVVAGGKRISDKQTSDQKLKRAAFGDITNASLNFINETLTKKAIRNSLKPKAPVVAVIKPSAKKGTQTKASTTAAIPADLVELTSSQESNSSSSQSSSASEGLSDSAEKFVPEAASDAESDSASQKEPEFDDIDKENLRDPSQCGLYAQDIFNYYRQRELQFPIPDYLSKQPEITALMRSILVDWLVEVQENFELNHETLYLAVKLVDLYLSVKNDVKKETLQLIGASSLFISCKFDERCPPLTEDFLYICDDAYTKQQFLQMEIKILNTIDFDLGIPLSYRFLRRFAKCGRSSMETLTLSRYILELSLMEYDLVHERDSKLAAACLSLALRMKKSGEWTPTLVHYTSYKSDDLEVLVKRLNSMLTSPPNKQLNTVRSKYSHEVFYKVAHTPPLYVLQLI